MTINAGLIFTTQILEEAKLSRSPFRVGLIPLEADGGSQELSLEEGVLYHRVVCTCPNEDFTGPAKWDIAVYKLITNEQFQLMNDWMSYFLAINLRLVSITRLVH